VSSGHCLSSFVSRFPDVLDNTGIGESRQVIGTTTKNVPSAGKSGAMPGQAEALVAPRVRARQGEPQRQYGGTIGRGYPT
jgi:hypothetical protein